MAVRQENTTRAINITVVYFFHDYAYSKLNLRIRNPNLKGIGIKS
jgi:hypothetical protein